MKSLLAKFFALISGDQSEDRDNGRLKLISNRKGILKALNRAAETGNVVGIRCANLGEGLLLVGVDAVNEEHGDFVIVLKHYDLNGIHLLRNELALGEIESACEFTTAYKNPVLKTQLM